MWLCPHFPYLYFFMYPLQQTSTKCFCGYFSLHIFFPSTASYFMTFLWTFGVYFSRQVAPPTLKSHWSNVLLLYFCILNIKYVQIGFVFAHFNSNSNVEQKEELLKRILVPLFHVIPMNNDWRFLASKRKQKYHKTALYEIYTEI